MKRILAALFAFAVTAAATAAPTQAPPRDTAAGEQGFRALYKELVETNTALVGRQLHPGRRAHGRAPEGGGLSAGDLHPFAAPDHPKEGGLVAVYPGRDPKLKAILLLAHIDVVEAKREDWTRDPFTLVEENGSFYARGAMDDKAEASIWVDLLIRYRGRALPAAAHAQGGAHLRRGDGRRVQRRRVAHQEPPRTHRRGVRAQRGRLGRARCEAGNAYPSTSRRARSFHRTTCSKSPIRADTARGR